jgi:hypothetical protein
MGTLSAVRTEIPNFYAKTLNSQSCERRLTPEKAQQRSAIAPLPESIETQVDLVVRIIGRQLQTIGLSRTTFCVVKTVLIPVKVS